ncbi:hypothetical protein Airi02_041860 [Actinoallomurus iriomotensis]|uniref:Uncharacterized protein n=1 Tax=Actinoallomurus iriomotensis TaxID=478107 RepID=A0A9W6W0Z8_9ACTN|nr:hypothetical protein Airi02_041860 [Actinoallomurus iriomotensis]
MIWYSADGLGYHPYVSNGNAAAAVLLTAAILTGMHQAHGGWARRHVPARQSSSPERAVLGDANIPVRAIRRRPSHASPSSAGPEGKSAVVHRAGAKESPEIIVGYVDPERGPAAFHRLTKVAEGDRVKVVRHDHSVAWFKVDSVRRLAKVPFGHRSSSDAVRHAIARERSTTGRPELRLISVRAGADRQRRDTPQNVVVSAHLDRPPG